MTEEARPAGDLTNRDDVATEILDNAYMVGRLAFHIFRSASQGCFNSAKMTVDTQEKNIPYVDIRHPLTMQLARWSVDYSMQLIREGVVVVKKNDGPK